jgi:hypothetical protein
MEFRKCKECGFPRLLGKWLKWDDNGTIRQRTSPDFRVVIMEANFLDDLFGRIERSLGISVHHIVFEAQRSAAKGYIGNWLGGMRGKLLLLPGAKRLAVQAFNKLAILGGSVYSETKDYQPGQYGIARMRNPYSRDLMAAMVVGAFEALEGKPYRHAWKDEGEDLLLSVEAAAQPPDIAERMYLVFPPTHPGNVKFERCGRCKVPRDIRYLEWHEDEGKIVDTRRNTRVNFIDGYVPGTVFREFRKELGEAVVPIIIDAQKEYFLEYIRELGLLDEAGKRPEYGYHLLLDTLPLYGQGNPVSIIREQNRLEVIVENPYEELLLAGTVAACYQAIESEEPEVSFKTPEEGILQIVVRPAKR